MSSVGYCFNESDNGNDHRAAAIDLQAEKLTYPAAPCASYCYSTVRDYSIFFVSDSIDFGKQVLMWGIALGSRGVK